MPIVGMPDGTQVSFPDDMPAEQIRGLITQKFPDAGKPGFDERFKADAQAIKDAAPRVGQGEALARGAVQGATYNFSDEAAGAREAGIAGLPEEVQGAIRTLQKHFPSAALAGMGIGAGRYVADKLTGPGEATAAYDMTAGIERAKNKLAEEQNPGTYFAGNVAGGLATTPFVPGGTLLQGGSLGTRIAQGAKYGAAYGALAGAGEGEGAADTIGKTAVGGAVGGVAGGALSGAFGPRVAGNGQEVLQAAGRLGVEVPKGVASDSTAVQMLTQASRQLPLFGARIENSISRTNEGLEGAVQKGVQDLTGTSGSRDAVGAAARASLERGIEVADKRADAAFGQLRRSINPDAEVGLPSNVGATLDKIITSRLNAGETGLPIEGIKNVVELATRPQGASFNGLQRARSDIGKAIKWDERNGGFMAGDLKQAYGALSDAMEDVVRKTAKGSPDQAASLLTKANETFGNVVGQTKELSRFLRSGSDERIVDRIISYGSEKNGRGDLSKMNLLRRSMQSDEWDQLAGMTLQRLGQNNAGEFSTAFFAKNWNAMSPAARDMMFGKSGMGTRQWIDDIMTVSKRMNETGAFRNTSNTARGALTGAGVLSAGYSIYDPMSALEAGVKTAGVAAPLVYFLGRPATAASMSRWTRAYEHLITKPTTATLASVNVASRNLANQMGEAAGIKIDPSVFLKSLQGPVPARAQDEQQ